jgi:hypothetical protein
MAQQSHDATFLLFFIEQGVFIFILIVMTIFLLFPIHQLTNTNKYTYAMPEVFSNKSYMHILMLTKSSGHFQWGFSHGF